jgi:GDP-4-dehydro-6-deoxy-D-mannose reductase
MNPVPLSKSSTVVVTGGGGFVGKHLIDELRATAPHVRLVVWDTAVASLPPGVEGTEIDITQPESYRAFLREEKPQWIVHLAAVSSIPASLRDPDRTHRVNVEATRHLLAAIAEESADTAVFVTSSSDIYGAAAKEWGDTPLPELPLDQARPQNPYAESKAAMERMIEEQFNERCVRVRPFPHIGPGQGLGFVTADFASQIAAIEAGRQASRMRVGNLEAQRDFTDVRDVVRAYCLLLEKGVLGEVYHVASGTAVSIQSILDWLLSLSTKDITVEQDPGRMRPSDIPCLIGDADKLRQATGWQPNISLEQSLQDILEWWRQSEGDIR